MLIFLLVVLSLLQVPVLALAVWLGGDLVYALKRAASAEAALITMREERRTWQLMVANAEKAAREIQELSEAKTVRELAELRRIAQVVEWQTQNKEVLNAAPGAGIVDAAFVPGEQAPGGQSA